ncbi:GABA permease [Rhodococcus erythropolis]|uniref:GABA permease n=1 Tax=Rhodococcus erythropolis TaxID=1833 RepID=A0A6G9D1T3_RHOER|nr:amino acid permease [Rhodococcus erythropolis]QIP43052.1 GABA permease [Rhodococcus erythropolis]
MPDSSTETAEAASVHSTLKTGLKKRHLTMLSMGGVIGAGFFVGLSGIINQAGPGAVITCAICGIIVFLVMRMLGEMAVAKPCTGSFTEYARMALGDWAGFTTGWLYWYFWVIVVGIESVVGATLLSRWIHGVPLWLMSAVLLLVMTGVNLLSVSNFGEAEYWFAGIKVAVIIGFIVLGSLFVFGIWPGSEVDFSNLTGHGGFLPNGFTPVLVGVVAVIFSMTGAELVTIAAAESAEPAGAIRRATNTVVFRILAFFVVATFLLVTMLPWDSFVVGDSPFISALDLLGIPGAADILNLVVLVAVLSCLNSGLYTASRMLFALSVYNDAPAWMTRTNSRGVPVKGVLACTVAGYFCIAAGYIWPDTIFLFLVNSSGAICLFVYILICVSELRLRRRWERESPEILKFRVWLYPGLPIVVTGLILVILVGMGLNEPTRAEFVQSLVALGSSSPLTA